MRNSAGSTKPILWVDGAKAVCICLVVTMHEEWQLPLAGWAHYSELAHLWMAINKFLEPIRLPTFFLLSGILAANSIFAPRPDAFEKYVAKPLYLYFLWSVIFAIFLSKYPSLAPITSPGTAWIAKSLFMGSLAWYLYALALFHLFARVTRHLPAIPLLIACGVASLLLPLNLVDWAAYPYKLIQYLFFFLAGVRLKDIIVDWAEGVPGNRILFFLGVYVAGTMFAARSDFLILPLNMMGVGFSIAFFANVSRNLGRLAPIVQWLGRRTLFIYLLHFPLMCIVTALLKKWAGPSLLQSYWIGLAFPVMATLLVVPASLAIGTWCQRNGLRWLFDLPKGRRDRPPAGDLPALVGDGSVPA